MADIIRHPAGVKPLTTLWRLSWDTDSIACVIYRHDGGLQLRVESASTTLMSEPFDMRPRSMARTQALRDALKRRGWQDAS